MRKIVISVLALVFTAALVVTTALSQWYFSYNQDFRDENIPVRQDDIKENNELKNSSQTYTIYLFPSTLAINDYISYLDGITATKPEEKYGYIEPELDSEKKPVIDTDGRVKYDRHSADPYSGSLYGGDGAYVGNALVKDDSYNQLLLREDVSNRDGWHRTGTAINAYEQWHYLGAKPTGWDSYKISESPSKLTFPDKTEDGETTAYYTEMGGWDGIVEYYIDSGNSYTAGKIPKYLVGDPELDKPNNVLKYFKEEVVVRDANGNKVEDANGNYTNTTMGRNLHLYDRFGAWRYVEYGEGRYMPLKITVDENFSFDYFSTVVKEPISSMCDPLEWYNLTFSEWAYVDVSEYKYDEETGKRSGLPYYAQIAKDIIEKVDNNEKTIFTQEQMRVTNAFKSFDMAQYFDIMQDFSKYADSDNIIRLFPTFSNGKNYIAAADCNSKGTDGYNSTANSFGKGVSSSTVGGGDLISASYTYTGDYQDVHPLADTSRIATFSVNMLDEYKNTTTAVSDQYGLRNYQTTANYSGDSSFTSATTYLYDSGKVSPNMVKIPSGEKTFDEIDTAIYDGAAYYYYYSGGSMPEGYYRIYRLDSNKSGNYTFWCNYRDKDAPPNTDNYYIGDPSNYTSGWGFNIYYANNYDNLVGIASDGGNGRVDSDTKIGVDLYAIQETSSAGTVKNVKYAVLSNVNFDNLDGLTLYLQATASAGGWAGDSQTIYSFSFDTIQEITNYYGSGMYNVYIFMGDTYHDATSDSGGGQSGICIGNIVDDAISDRSLFNGALYGKDLLTIISNDTKNAPYLTSSRNIHTKECYRSVVVAIEKVRDIKILTNIDAEKQTLSDLDDSLKSAYENMNSSFRYVSEDIYTISPEDTTVDDMANQTPLNEKYPYCYYLGSVDFTNCTNDYFQIRFGSDYLSNSDSKLRFRGLGTVKTVDGSTLPDNFANDETPPAIHIVYDPDSKGSFEDDQVFVNACGDGGFFTAYVKSETKDGTTASQLFLKLNKKEDRGVYDFILVYVPNAFYSYTDKTTGETTEGTTKTHTVIIYDENDIPTGVTDYNTHEAGYYIFVHRQSNVFLKITANDPTKLYEKDENGNENNENNENFVNHSDYSDSVGTLIYQKSYYIGASVSGVDEYDVGMLTDNSLLAANVNGYVENWLKKLNSENNSDYTYTIEDIILRDHTTTAVVAGYEKVTDVDGEKLDKGYYYKVDSEDSDGNTTYSYYELKFDENFIIRKNYVFYVTTKDKSVNYTGTNASNAAAGDSSDVTTDSTTDGSSDGAN